MLFKITHLHFDRYHALKKIERNVGKEAKPPSKCMQRRHKVREQVYSTLLLGPCSVNLLTHDSHPQRNILRQRTAASSHFCDLCMRCVIDGNQISRIGSRSGLWDRSVILTSKFRALRVSYRDIGREEMARSALGFLQRKGHFASTAADACKRYRRSCLIKGCC